MADFPTSAFQSMRLPSACCATSCSAVRIVAGAYLRRIARRAKTLGQSRTGGVLRAEGGRTCGGGGTRRPRREGASASPCRSRSPAQSPPPSYSSALVALWVLRLFCFLFSFLLFFSASGSLLWFRAKIEWSLTRY